MKIKKYKGGFTLIELLISLGIFTIITTVSLNIIISASKQYILYINKSTELDNLDNCLINIDNIIRDNYITDINIEGDKIEVVSKLVHNGKSVKKKIIYKKDSNLMVKTLINDDLDTSAGNNILLKNVKEFNVLQKGELIYFEIVTNNEEKRIRCI
ncbi:type II secretion system protein [Clostridium sp. NSJ-6]|uniref:Type II secretion system protein n=1 Tax=Clostridium hominis TaxID=2763036 RepID=A0ABR7D7Z6_9CLOT|nr:type II secretion system protein [Clostridium hominis]MDU2672564.1 type II secretion system protein [Clostridium sp.]